LAKFCLPFDFGFEPTWKAITAEIPASLPFELGMKKTFGKSLPSNRKDHSLHYAKIVPVWRSPGRELVTI
jgi:hypothetical protein